MEYFLHLYTPLKKLVKYLVLPVLAAGCTVEVDRGPFDIREDESLITGKVAYLDSLEPAAPGAVLPNILLILADDLGKHDISTYNPEGVPVPSLDRLASRGVRFNNAYASSPVCSPSRVSMLTGRYQQRFGFERQPMNRYPRNRLEYWAVDHFVNTDPMQLVSPMANPGEQNITHQGIPSGEILLSELLARRGYHTGIFGKWHLGFHEEFLPGNRGFQEQFGFYEAFSLYAPVGTSGIVEHRHDYFASKHIWKQKRNGTCAIRENGKEIYDPEYLTFSIASRACRFLEESRDGPFFLYVPFSAPHTPFQVPQEYFDRFPNEKDHNRRVYYGMISALDDAVGMILAKLDSLGLAENTLVMFASDNGGATYTGATDNGPLKAGKFAQFEGGVNIPMIFSWPGRIAPGPGYTEPVSLMDIFVTAASMAGVQLPSDRNYDGIDLLAVLGNNETTGSERPLFWRTDFNHAVRSGPWKLIWNERDKQVFLYDLEKDPGEHMNLAPGMPGKVTELQQMIRQWESEMKDPMWPGVMEFRFDLDGETTLWAI
jgi:arylsulfatase A-like enzyme